MANAIYHAPAQCPVCGHSTTVTRVRCSHCGTELTGEFAPCRFCKLEEKHLQFVETFLRCRGSIKEVERALGVSYPTVKNMLDAALQALGLEDRPQGAQERRQQVLEQLSQGELDVDAAVEALNKLKGGRGNG